LLLVDLNVNNLTVSTVVGLAVRFEFSLSSRVGSESSQRFFVRGAITTEQPALSFGGVSSLWNVSRHVAITANSASDQNFQIDAIWSGASISNSLEGYGYEIHKVR